MRVVVVSDVYLGLEQRRSSQSRGDVGPHQDPAGPSTPKLAPDEDQHQVSVRFQVQVQGHAQIQVRVFFLLVERLKEIWGCDVLVGPEEG